jgi:hypothetical protein
MSDLVRCYLDKDMPLSEEFEQHIVQHYQGRQIDIRFKQEMLLDSSRLLIFLVTLPDIEQGETHYTRRIFLSALPLLVPSVIYLEHIASSDSDRPIGESSLEQVREWLRMSQWGRQFKRELWHREALHTGPDVPLMSGNMREE